ncbi:MAG TPA: Crp/Fnr family transcriptional regulator [Bryobacteraceae bacterium]|jgi:CRP/FNR family transcriptional regulator|nr:Crp/Fnr family transcriptional regulator [Bryobacteraceae bacterium]
MPPKRGEAALSPAVLDEKEANVKLLESTAQEDLRSLPDSTCQVSLQRCASIYAQSQTVEFLFLIEEGLVKLTRSNERGEKIILAVSGPGQLVGEEALSQDAEQYYTDAVALTAASVTRIPQRSLKQALAQNAALTAALVGYLLSRKMDLATKVELLCLHDVEYRILHYINDLSRLLPQGQNGDGYQIPITQLELADLVGATRETTSTTLNQLERRGLLKLSRRLLTVPSPEALVEAAGNHSAAPLTAAVNGAQQ